MTMKELIILIVCYFIILAAFCLMILYSLNAEMLTYELQEIDILDNLNLRRYND